MKEEIKMFLERAKKFERDAEYDFSNRDYDLAMFHIEQAAQLLIKTKLLEVKGSFQRSHNLRRLLLELNENLKDKRIEEFIEKNKRILRDLERAYISSQYIYEEFFEDEVKEGFKALKELRDILWS
jgi:HEPN domain-containing protein